MSFNSTFTSISVNGWKSKNTEKRYFLNTAVINNLPRPTGQTFGAKVAISDDGVYFACSNFSPDDNIGRVWIFKNNLNGTYTQMNSFTYPSDTILSISMNATGEYLAIKAGYFTSVFPFEWVTPVYIYNRIGSTWTLQQTISTTQTNKGYNTKLSGDGNYLIIDGPNLSNVQSIYVYNRTGSVWSQEQIITPDTVTTRFGAITINYNGNYIATTCPDPVNRYVWIYYKNLGIYSLGAKLDYRTYGSINGTGFGNVIDISNNGESIIVNSEYRGPTNFPGGVYQIKKIYDTSWQQISIPVRGTGPANEAFATDIKISGDGSTIVASAPGATVNGISNAGQLYVLKHTNILPVVTNNFLYTNPIQTNSSIGQNLGTDINETGDIIIAGASGMDNYGTNSGGAFIYNAA